MSIRPNSKGHFPRLMKDGEGVFRGRVSLGNMTEFQFCVIDFGDEILVAIIDRGAYLFDSYVHWSYAMEHLGLKFQADAANVADFINDQLSELGYEPGPLPRQGTYEYKNLLRD